MHAAPAPTSPLSGSDQPSGCPAIPVLLAEFFCPQAVTLPHILASHNISPEQLLAWIKDPKNQSTIAAIHELNNLRRDFALSHARTDSLGILLGIQERFRKQMETTSDGFGVSDRLTESARKASLHLLAVTGDLKSPPPRSRVLQDPRCGGAEDKVTHAGWQEGATAPASNRNSARSLKTTRASDRGSARSLSEDPTPTPPPPAQQVREHSGRGQARVEESPWRPTGLDPSPTPTMPSPNPDSQADESHSQQSPPHTPASPPLSSEDLFRRVEDLLKARTQQRAPQQPSGP